jgi:SPP1 gp7 family putative phage head morphogenesis protein
MPTSRLQQVISQYRAQLAAHESTATRALQTAHAHTVAKIQPHLDTLYKQIGDAQASGTPVSPSWLYQANRLKTTKQLISGEIDQYGALAKTTTNQLQRTGVQIGEASGMAQLNATKTSGIAYSFGTPSQGAMESIVGATQKGSPLADLFDGFGAEAAEQAGQSLITGITLGDNPRRIASMVASALDISRWRALTISRTEMIRAYRLSNQDIFRANDDVVDSWVWISALDARCCAVCIAMHGTIHPLSEDMGSHPNCRCTPTPRTKDWSAILGRDIGISNPEPLQGSDWFDNQSESTQRAILGSNAAYDAYSNGASLSDFVGKSSDPDWGDSVYQRSAKDVSG